MDWKLIIAICYCFRILQAVNVSMADVRDITVNSLIRSNCDVNFGSRRKLCNDCIYKSELLEILPAEWLLVDIKFSKNEGTVNVTVQTQKDRTTNLKDAYSMTLSFNSLNVVETFYIPKNDRYVTISLAGNNCNREYQMVSLRYYFVAEQNYLLTVFPASSVPNKSEEKLVVGGKCAANAGDLNKPTMTIYSNGTIVREGFCECNPGFQLSGSSCEGGSLILYFRQFN